MLITNPTLRRMKYLKWYKTTIQLHKGALELHRDDRRIIQIQLNDEDRRKLIIALGGWYQPKLDQQHQGHS